MQNDSYDVIVVGAGQAGLAMGYYLQQSSYSFLLLDAHHRVGDSWRERYDSLQLFTPRRYSQLPGMTFPGDPDGLPNKEEAADYLEQYAALFSLQIKHNQLVTNLERSEAGFRIVTKEKEYRAKQVVIATGPFQTPFIPSLAKQASDEVFQIHTSAYSSPKQLKDGNVLVVGAGNSGIQIAAEAALEKQVLLSVGHPPKFLPLSLFGRSIFWYCEQLGLLTANSSTKRGAWLKKRPDPVFGYKKELQRLESQGSIQWRGRTLSLEGNTVRFSDGSMEKVDNIIWATGFRPDYSWIKMNDLLDLEGKPVHQRGVTRVDGLYFLGLSWQNSRTSALMGGVGGDAQFLADEIKRHAEKSQSPGRSSYGSAS